MNFDKLVPKEISRINSLAKEFPSVQNAALKAIELSSFQTKINAISKNSPWHQLDEILKHQNSLQTVFEVASKAVPLYQTPLQSIFKEQESLFKNIISPLQKNIGTLPIAQSYFANFNAAVQALQPIYQIVDKVSFFQNNLPKTVMLANKYIDSLSILNKLKLNYCEIIDRQKESFKQVNYLRPFQKRLLLRSEQLQKENIVLGSADFKYSGIITLDVENTIILVNDFSGNQYKDTAFDFDFIHTDQESELYDRLQYLGKSCLDALLGAKQTAQSNNPDKLRQVVISLRELLKMVINKLAPTDIVLNWCTNNGYKDNPGKHLIEYKISFIFRNILGSSLQPFIVENTRSIKQILDMLSPIVHSLDDKLSVNSLNALILLVETKINLLLTYANYKSEESPYG